MGSSKLGKGRETTGVRLTTLLLGVTTPRLLTVALVPTVSHTSMGVMFACSLVTVTVARVTTLQITNNVESSQQRNLEN